MICNLLPEEDALDDPDDDEEADPTLPGDLWFRGRLSGLQMTRGRRRASGPIVYFETFAPTSA